MKMLFSLKLLIIEGFRLRSLALFLKKMVRSAIIKPQGAIARSVLGFLRQPNLLAVFEKNGTICNH